MPRISSTRPHSGIAAQRVAGFAAAAGCSGVSVGAGAETSSVPFILLSSSRVIFICFILSLKVFYTFPKSVFPNYSASIIFATMAVAVLMYSPMLNFFTTRTS